MQLRRAISCGLVGLLIPAGCVTNSQALRDALSKDELEDVISEVKRQVQVYRFYVGNIRRNPELDEARESARSLGFECGDGSIDFEIVSIKFDLKTTIETKIGGSLDFSASIGPVTAPGTLGFGASASRKEKNTQQLVFYTYPEPYVAEVIDPRTINLDEAPIATALVTLRSAMIHAATSEGACVRTYDYESPDKDTGNTYKIGLEVTENASGGVSVGLAIVKVGASTENTSITGNEITVKFRQVGIPTTKPRRKPPKDNCVGAGVVAC